MRTGTCLVAVSLIGCGGASSRHQAGGGGASGRSSGGGAGGATKGGTAGSAASGGGATASGGSGAKAGAAGSAALSGGTGAGGTNGASGGHGAKAGAAGAGFAGGSGSGTASSGRAGAGADGATGGASSDSGAGGEGGESIGAVPTKDGVPIGNCTEPTPAEQLAASCPLTEPENGAVCDFDDLVCRYQIVTDSTGMSSAQANALCHGSIWQTGSPFLEACADSCTTPPGTVMRFDIGDCGARELTECTPSKMFNYVPATAQQLTDALLDDLLFECSGSPPFNNVVQVDFAGGCPSGISATVSLDPTVFDCLKQKLAQVRWECATDLLCTVWNLYI